MIIPASFNFPPATLSPPRNVISAAHSESVGTCQPVGHTFLPPLLPDLLYTNYTKLHNQLYNWIHHYDTNNNLVLSVLAHVLISVTRGIGSIIVVFRGSKILQHPYLSTNGYSIIEIKVHVGDR